MKACIRASLWVVAVGLGIVSGTEAGAQVGGIPLWTNVYDGGLTSEGVYALAVDRSGNVFVSGWTGIPTNDFLTIKYSAAGARLWTNRYSGPDYSIDGAQLIALDTNGNAFVSGRFGSICATLKYSATGVPLWTNYIGISGNGPTGIAVDHSGRVFVTGGSGDYFTLGDYLTVAYSNSGVPLWTNRYNGPVNGGDIAQALAVDASGNVIVTGGSADISGSLKIATVKYSGTGVPLWTNRNDSVLYSSGSAVAVDGSGNIFISGAGSYGYSAIIKYSGAGALLWTKNFPGIGGGRLALDSGGNVYAAVSSFNAVSTNYDFLTVKYSGAGAALWTKTFNGPDNVDDYVYSLAVDSTGNVFVHGQSIEGPPVDTYWLKFITLGYSSGGVPLWTNFFNGNGWATEARAVAVDPNGNVVVAGATAERSGDIVVIKYSSSYPQLTITRTATNTVAVSWPSPSTGFGLQQNSNSISSLNWSNVSAGIQNDGTKKTFIANPPTETRFYRLYKP